MRSARPVATIRKAPAGLPRVRAAERPRGSDVDLGLRLLLDRRVSRRQKGEALLLGLALGAPLVASVALLAALSLGAPWSALSSVPLALAAIQALLLSAAIAGLHLIRNAPLPVVSRVHVERYRVIPIRPRPATASRPTTR